MRGVANTASVLLSIGAMVSAACDDAETTRDGPSTSAATTMPASTVVPTRTSASASEPIAPGEPASSAPVSGDLRGGLVAAGAAIESVPPDVVTAFRAPLCGVVLADRPADGDRASVQCPIDATGDRRSASLVVVVYTTEGDPLVEVWLTHAAEVSVAVDSTRDEFGAAGWSTRACNELDLTGPTDRWTSPLRCA